MRGDCFPSQHTQDHVESVSAAFSVPESIMYQINMDCSSRGKIIRFPLQ